MKTVKKYNTLLNLSPFCNIVKDAVSLNLQPVSKNVPSLVTSKDLKIFWVEQLVALNYPEKLYASFACSMQSFHLLHSSSAGKFRFASPLHQI